MARLFTAIACTIRRAGFGRAGRRRACAAGASRAGARTGEHRRRRRTGDRRGGQHLDLADGRQTRPAVQAPAHGRSCRPARRSRNSSRSSSRTGAARATARRRTGRRAASTRSAPASSSMPPASSSPTITSSRKPTRSPSSSTTAPLEGRVVGRDQKTDLAVLRVKPDKPLKAVKFGDSDKLRLGEWVIAIGNPFGLGGTVTAGIVSARNRDINSGPYDNYIQTDAVDQPRQFRRPAVQHGRRSDRRQHRDHLAVGRLDRHRLRGSVEDRDGGHRPAPQVRRDAARLARRAHPAGHRRDRREPQHQAGARRADRRRRRQGPGEARRHRAGRRDRQVRRQGHQGDARPAAHRRRHAGRQGCRGHVIRKGKEETKTVKLGRLEDGEKPVPASAKADADAERSRSCRSRSAWSSPT